MCNNAGKALARSREMFISREGSWVTLNTGVRLKALIKHTDHDLLGTITDDDDAQKQAVVFVFGGSAWGKVLENMIVTVGEIVMGGEAGGAATPAVDMSRGFRVAAPLHPKWRAGVVTELAVAAYQDV